MQKREILAAAYAAFNRRDIEAVLCLMNADVDWPNGLEGGRVRGRDQVRAYWQRQWETLEPRVDPVRIEDNESGDTVVVVHQVVRDLSGAVLADRLIEHVYTIRDGLIQRMDIRPE